MINVLNKDQAFIQIIDDGHMMSMNIIKFQDPTTLTMDAQFQTNTPPLQMITNQLKENIIQV